MLDREAQASLNVRGGGRGLRIFFKLVQQMGQKKVCSQPTCKIYVHNERKRTIILWY